MVDIDRVAEAIWRAQRPEEARYTWDECLYPKHYRSLAQAAIAAIFAGDRGSRAVDDGGPQQVTLSGREYERYLEGALNDSATDTDKDVEAKLSFLRQGAADALNTYLTMAFHPRFGQGPTTVNLAALDYLNAHTKYTLACLEAKRGDILPYVELPERKQS